jgi:hypothetical protein
MGEILFASALMDTAGFIVRTETHVIQILVILDNVLINMEIISVNVHLVIVVNIVRIKIHVIQTLVKMDSA